MSANSRAERTRVSRQAEREQARLRQRQRVTRDRWLRRGLGVTVVLAAVVVAGLLVTRSVQARPGRFVQSIGQQHMDKGTAHAAYNSMPPTSGPHWVIAGEAPVSWGIYDAPIPDEAQVHNLEHGGIMIQYSCRDCPDLVRQLEVFYNRWTPAHRLSDFPNSTKIVIAPYYDMPSRIALTAWTRIDTLDAYDEDRIAQFVEAYRDHGPEAVM